MGFGTARAGYANYDNKILEGAVSGPLFAGTRGRLAASWGNVGKGIYENLNPNGKDEGNRGSIWTVEGQLDGNLADGKFEWWAKAVTDEV